MRIGFVKIGMTFALDHEQEHAHGGDRMVLGLLRYLRDRGHKIFIGSTATGHMDGVEVIDRFSRMPSVDIGLVVCGPNTGLNWKMAMSARRAQPVVEWINASMVPYIYLLQDPRYLPRWRELHNLPRLMLSQFEGDEERKCNFTQCCFHHTYGALELWQFYGIEKRQWTYDEWMQRPLDVIIGYHDHHGEGGCGKKNDVWARCMDPLTVPYEVYGNWTISSGPQYKGVVPASEILGLLTRGRYTFIVPICHGWVSPKLYEAMQMGVVPLLYGRGENMTYDSQLHSGVAYDDPLRVTSAEEIERIVRERSPALREHARELLDPYAPFIRDGGLLDKYLGRWLGNLPAGPAISNPWEPLDTSVADIVRYNTSFCEPLRMMPVYSDALVNGRWQSFQALLQEHGLDKVKAMYADLSVNAPEHLRRSADA